MRFLKLLSIAETVLLKTSYFSIFGIMIDDSRPTRGLVYVSNALERIFRPKAMCGNPEWKGINTVDSWSTFCRELIVDHNRIMLSFGFFIIKGHYILVGLFSSAEPPHRLLAKYVHITCLCFTEDSMEPLYVVSISPVHTSFIVMAVYNIHSIVREPLQGAGLSSQITRGCQIWFETVPNGG